MDHRLDASSEPTCLYLSYGTKGPFLHPAVLERNEADAKCWQNLGELESSRVPPPDLPPPNPLPILPRLPGAGEENSYEGPSYMSGMDVSELFSPLCPLRSSKEPLP